MEEDTLLPSSTYIQTCGFLNAISLGTLLCRDASDSMHLWQLVGFFLAWRGYPGKGRALGAGEVKFTGEIRPDAKKGHL